MDFPIISELVPATLIRRSLIDHGSPFVEQVRLSSIVQQQLLPSIGMRLPSRLRDTLRTLMAGGVNEVDFILARAPGVAPWGFDKPEILEMFIPYFNATQGAVAIFPDAGGPWPRSFVQHTGDDLYERQARLIQAGRLYSRHLIDNYQLGLMDLVGCPKEELTEYLFSLRGVDVAMCAWSGEFREMRIHGWRTAGAAVAALPDAAHGQC